MFRRWCCWFGLTRMISAMHEGDDMVSATFGFELLACLFAMVCVVACVVVLL